MIRPLALVSALLAAAPALAGEPAVDPLTARFDLASEHAHYPDRIIDTLVLPRWLSDGDRFVYWAATGPNRDTFVLVDARTQRATPLLPSEALLDQLSALLGKKLPPPRYLPFAIAADQQGIVFTVQGRRFALGLADRRVVALAPDDVAARVLPEPGAFASPDRRFLAAPKKAGGFALLGPDGKPVVERANAENLTWQLPERGWSPDGRFLLVWRNDTRKVHPLPLIDYSSADEKVTWEPYVKSGTPLATPELHVVEPATGKVTQVAAAEGEGYEWLAGWRPDGSEALVLRIDRTGKRLELWAVAPATGKRRLVLHEERPETFVADLALDQGGWMTQVVPLHDNRRFLWMSERDGWRHVYLYDYAGAALKQLTRGAFPVHEVVGVDPKDEALLLLASPNPAAPYDRVLLRAGLSGGALRQVAREPGIRRVVLSPSGRYFVDGHSTREQPRAWDVGSTDGKSTFRVAQADTSGLAAIHFSPPEPITARAADGKTTLHGVLFKPWDFDPAKKYPVIDVIYGGPFLNAVPWSYVGTSESRRASALAQLGFVTVVLDARGTPGRGKAFLDATYGRVGQQEIPEHVAAIKEVAASRPWMDLERAGIWGGSWGGYFTLRGMLTAPDFFKAGYAEAPGALEEDALVNEPNLGLPSANPAGYRAGDNTAVAGNLRGALKLVHGTSDVNAPFSVTMRMADALIRAGKHFDLLVVPNAGHSPRPQDLRYYFDDLGRFFLHTLGGPVERAR